MIKNHKNYKVKEKFFIYDVLRDKDGNICSIWFERCLVIYKLEFSRLLGIPYYGRDEIFTKVQVERLRKYFSDSYSDESRYQVIRFAFGLSIAQYEALKEYFNQWKTLNPTSYRW